MKNIFIPENDEESSFYEPIYPNSSFSITEEPIWPTKTNPINTLLNYIVVSDEEFPLFLNSLPVNLNDLIPPEPIFTL